MGYFSGSLIPEVFKLYTMEPKELSSAAMGNTGLWLAILLQRGKSYIIYFSYRNFL